MEVADSKGKTSGAEEERGRGNRAKVKGKRKKVTIRETALEWSTLMAFPYALRLEPYAEILLMVKMKSRKKQIKWS